MGGAVVVGAIEPDGAFALCRGCASATCRSSRCCCWCPAPSWATSSCATTCSTTSASTRSSRRARGPPKHLDPWRTGRGTRPELVEYGPLVLNLETYQAAIEGAPLDLTYMEYELLKFLASHPGRVFTRETLLSRVWGYEYYGGARTVDVHIRRLRAKLGEEHANLIQTVRSVGYRFGQSRWGLWTAGPGSLFGRQFGSRPPDESGLDERWSGSSGRRGWWMAVSVGIDVAEERKGARPHRSRRRSAPGRHARSGHARRRHGGDRRASPRRGLHRLAAGMGVSGTDRRRRTSAAPDRHHGVRHAHGPGSSPLLPLDAGRLLDLRGHRRRLPPLPDPVPCGAQRWRSFPEASAVLLEGRLRSKDEPKVRFRRRVLADRGIDTAGLRTGDAVDAALAALTGLLALEGCSPPSEIPTRESSWSRCGRFRPSRSCGQRRGRLGGSRPPPLHRQACRRATVRDVQSSSIRATPGSAITRRWSSTSPTARPRRRSGARCRQRRRPALAKTSARPVLRPHDGYDAWDPARRTPCP